jgi:predicted nucleic acid-binding Zn ribbon protein
MEAGDVGALDPTAAFAATDPGHVCIMCDAPTEQADACCSLPCAQAAQRELQRNVTRLRHLARRLAPPDARRRVAERNGRLSSALLRWRPDSTAMTETG